MAYANSTKKLAAYRRQIADIRKKMRSVQADIEPQEVEDYAFGTSNGTKRLSELFGDKDDLIVIHNMGNSCPYCTLWADGFNGIYDHVADRAAFVVASPDRPAAQKKFADSRGWRFPMVSHAGSTFADDMGYKSAKGGWAPGVSVFRRQGGRIMRVSDAELAPYDDFCAIWHFLDLFPEGSAGWQPKFKYGRQRRAA